MSLMLGNQYFMARKYSEALKELAEYFNHNPQDKGTHRKLIICYAMAGKLNSALNLFLSLVSSDIDFILEADPIHDDCPCPEIVYDLENDLKYDRKSSSYFKNLGVLWLYCDLNKSIENFEKAIEMDKNDPTIKSILTHLNAKKNSIKK
jgi:tetratricopeptide (TPR) repeat protein